MIVVCDSDQSVVALKGLPARWMIQIDELSFPVELFREIAALKDGEKVIISKTEKGLEIKKEEPTKEEPSA